MKITKLQHSCLLVETQGRTALFDPGSFSIVDVDSLERLDDIIITHEHGDHMDINLIKRLVESFPGVRIKASSQATGILNDAGLKGSTLQDADEGVAVFDAPHEPVEPMFPTPDNMGVHYQGSLTHPGDCTHFDTTMPILALPVTAPWGSTVQAVNLALELKPRFVIPIHDWHWNDEARTMMYENMARVFEAAGIEFIKAENGQPFELDV